LADLSAEDRALVLRCVAHHPGLSVAEALEYLIEAGL
jgi:hypothetical protein